MESRLYGNSGISCEHRVRHVRIVLCQKRLGSNDATIAELRAFHYCYPKANPASVAYHDWLRACGNLLTCCTVFHTMEISVKNGDVPTSQHQVAYRDRLLAGKSQSSIQNHVFPYSQDSLFADFYNTIISYANFIVQNYPPPN